MRKNLIKIFFAVGVALGARVETRADFVPGKVYGTQASGCETASFASVSAYAEENHIPLVVILGDKGCGYCTPLQTELRRGVSSDLPVIFYNYYSKSREVFSSDVWHAAENVLAEGYLTLTVVFCKWVRDDGTTIVRTKYWGQICNGTSDRIKSFADVERFAAEIFDSSYVQLACGIPDSPKTQLQIVTKGSPIGNLPVPFRRGFSFVGWFTAKTGGDKVSSDYVAAEDLTLYAHWIPANITFGNKWYEALADDEGVTCVGWKNFYMGANVAIPVTVTDANGDSVALTSDDITVKPGTYVDYGTPYVITEAEMWETYGRPIFDTRNSGRRIDLEKDGGVWVYNNWDWEDEAGFTYELEKGIWPFFDNGNSDYHDVDNWLDAHGDRQWIVIPTGTRPQKGTHTFTVQVSIGGNTAKYPVSFTMSPDQKATATTVRFNANGGKVSEYGRVVSLNKAIGALPVPEARRGYTFKGWFTAKTNGTKITAATKVTKAVTVYAQWTAKKYKITVTAHGGKINGAGSYAAGSKVKLTMTPAKGRQFSQWAARFDFDGDGEDDREREYSDEEKSIKDAFWRGKSSISNPTLTFTMPPCDMRFEGWAIAKSEDFAPLFDFDGPNPWYVEDGGAVDVGLDPATLASFSANESIPSGIKLVRVDDWWYTLKIADASKLPAGTKTVTFTATSRFGKKSTLKLRVVMPNKTQAVDAGALALQHLDSHEHYALKAGVKNQWNALGIQALNGWTLSAVTGIPGLTWDAKNGKMKGIPSKKGLYTATFTVTKGKSKKVATANFLVEALPGNVIGTFYGYTALPGEYGWDEEDNYVEIEPPQFGKKSRKVTVVSGTDGKITIKIGTLTLSATGWTIDEDGNYKVSAYAKKRNGKYLDVDNVWFAINPNAKWNEDSLTGSVDSWRSVYVKCVKGQTCAMTPTWPRTSDTWFTARKNAAATSEDAKAIATRYAKLGKQSFIVRKASSGSGYAYDLVCPNCDARGGAATKTLFAKIEANGKVTLTGTIAGTKVSGTTYLTYERRKYYDGGLKDEDESFEVAARFFIGKLTVEISGPADMDDLPSNGTLIGRAWKR